MDVDLIGTTLVERVPGWAGRVRQVDPLEGGITNRNYRVLVGDEAFVVRVPAQTGALLRLLQGHTNWVRSVTFSPDGTRIATGSWDVTAKVWDGRPSEP